MWPGAYPRGERLKGAPPLKASSLLKVLDYPVANTLAYFAAASVTKKKFYKVELRKIKDHMPTTSSHQDIKLSVINSVS